MVSFSLTQVPENYSVNWKPVRPFKIRPNSTYRIEINFSASPGATSARFFAEVNDEGKLLPMQSGLINLDAKKDTPPGKK